MATDMNIMHADDTLREAPGRRYLGLLDVGVLLLALLAFLIFLMLLNRFVFPQGSRLGDIASLSDTVAPGSDERGEMALAGADDRRFGSFIAQLADVRREVKIRSGDAVAWSNAVRGAAVRNRDAIQTFADSRARVDFTTDNELRIGQNSLVIFRSGAADPFLQRREPAVVVMEGELAGDVNADYGEFAMQIPAGTVVLRSDSDTGAAVDFKVAVNPDKSSTLAVYSGEADVDVAGSRYRVSANSGITITEDGSTAGVRRLPSVPAVHAPTADAFAAYRDVPPRIEFRWGEVRDAQQYRLEIARDARFEEILVDERLTDPAFTHGNLPSGAYFWRVSARNGWLQGPATDARRVIVVRDVEPPVLELESVRQTAAGTYHLRGKTSRDATVYVRGERVAPSASGEFEYAFDAEPGANTILVEAVDDVGNVAYGSQVFYAQNFLGRSN